MPELTVRNWDNKKVRSLDLSDAVFAEPFKEGLVHQAVHHHMAGRRSGTASTRGRGKVQGSGRKLWRQKKTGRARIGSIRSPLWRSGGTVHGPKPRDYSYHMPRKMLRGALRSVLSQRVGEDRLLVLDSLNLSSHRTKELLESLKGLGVQERTVLLVAEGEDQKMLLAARNLPNVHALSLSSLNAYDVLAKEYLVMSEAAAKLLNERLAR
jgi:large subunit ribosomal protein L4